MWHNMHVYSSRERGLGWWEADCYNCGWRGEPREDRLVAVADAEAHGTLTHRPSVEHGEDGRHTAYCFECGWRGASQKDPIWALDDAELHAKDFDVDYDAADWAPVRSSLISEL